MLVRRWSVSQIIFKTGWKALTTNWILSFMVRNLVFIRSSISFYLGFGFLVSDSGSNKLAGSLLRQNLVNWLSPPDLYTNFKDASDAHHESTGEWLTQGSIFKSWKQSSSLLWINGKRTFYNPWAPSFANRTPCLQRVPVKPFLCTSSTNSLFTG